MMIEWDATDFPILPNMVFRTGNNRLGLLCKRTTVRPWLWLIGCLIIPASPHAWGQTIESPSSLLVPSPDQQPASPWSKPFRVSVPKGQPPRHEMTQRDSLDKASMEDRVPGVAPSDTERLESSNFDLPRSEKPIRANLASRVSNDMLTPSLISSSRKVQPIENPPGWASVETNLRSNLERCDHLLRRGAVHSARQEAVGALRQLFRTLDLHKRVWESEPVFQQGLLALKESEDFERTQITGLTLMHRLVQSHQTTILQETNLDSISPAIAAQHYRAYARDAFLTAADGHPWAADLFYALGKTYEKESQQQTERSLTLLQHATVCFQTAHSVDPRRSHIANQLGFNLLQLDKTDEAIVALNSAIATGPSANAYSNLAEALRRMGRTVEMQQALRQATALTSKETRYSPENPEITEITPEDFARISPPTSGHEFHQEPSKISSRPLFPSSSR